MSKWPSGFFLSLSLPWIYRGWRLCSIFFISDIDDKGANFSFIHLGGGKMVILS